MGKRIYDLEEIQQIDDNDYLLVDKKGTEESQKIKASNFKSLIVNITISMNEKNNFEIVSDKTYDEIFNAYTSNKQLLLIVYYKATTNVYYYATNYIYLENMFIFVFFDGSIEYRLHLENNNNWSFIYNEVLRKENVLGLSELINNIKICDEKLKYYGNSDIKITDINYFEFETDESTMTATISLKEEYEDFSGELVIPYKYTVDEKEYLVTHINSEGFYEAYNITKITMPNTIVDIGSAAFASCTSMTSINLSNGITHLRGVTFVQCRSLTSINIPYGVQDIQSGCFLYCINLENITIPTTVIQIDIDAFMNDDKLTITCAEGSYADTYAKENGIPVIYTNEVTKQFVLDEINEKVGDIDTALDSIIAIQETFISGQAKRGFVDRVTNKTYDMYVSNGKLKLEESEG